MKNGKKFILTKDDDDLNEGDVVIWNDTEETSCPYVYLENKKPSKDHCVNADYLKPVKEKDLSAGKEVEEKEDEDLLGFSHDQIILDDPLKPVLPKDIAKITNGTELKVVSKYQVGEVVKFKMQATTDKRPFHEERTSYSKITGIIPKVISEGGIHTVSLGYTTENKKFIFDKDIIEKIG